MIKLKENELGMISNEQTLHDYQQRLKLLATSLFNWKGLDEICGYGATRFVEQALYEFGRACFVKDDNLGYMVTNANPSDTLNTYNLPTKINAWSITYNKQYDLDDCVYFGNNDLFVPTWNTIELMARRLYEIERTIDVNLVAQKTPVLIEGDAKSILTLKNVYMQYSGNIPFIFGNKQFDISGKLNVLNTNAPYLIDRLEEHKANIWNDALTYLGINNANTDKRERLITDEVNANNDLINFYLNTFYKSRKDACNRINEKYGLNIDIEVNQDAMNLSMKDIKEDYFDDEVVDEIEEVKEGDKK